MILSGIHYDLENQVWFICWEITTAQQIKWKNYLIKVFEILPF